MQYIGICEMRITVGVADDGFQLWLPIFLWFSCLDPYKKVTNEYGRTMLRSLCHSWSHSLRNCSIHTRYYTSFSQFLTSEQQPDFDTVSNLHGKRILVDQPLEQYNADRASQPVTNSLKLYLF